MKPQLLLIDALNLIRRIYAVDANQKQHSEQQIIANSCARVHQACKKLVARNRPTHAIAVFDGESSWRYHYFAQYKHSRPAMPAALKQALPLFHQAIEQSGIVVYQSANDEADDVIATLAKKAANNNISSTIISTDKGFLPLLSSHITIYDYFKKNHVDETDILQRFGVAKHRLIEFWALAGDKTNDIPGVKGIGTKSAQQIINNYNSIDSALACSALPAQLQKKLQSELSMFIISKQLVSLRSDIQLGFTLKQLRLNAN